MFSPLKLLNDIYIFAEQFNTKLTKMKKILIDNPI